MAKNNVVPLAGTWIETSFILRISSSCVVVPLAGTWIETSPQKEEQEGNNVVPLAGTWIETSFLVYSPSSSTPSFPSRERGLKLFECHSCTGFCSRSPRGNVD